jgi:hypothetical protein
MGRDRGDARLDRDVGRDAGVGDVLAVCRKGADQRNVHLDAGVRQSGEEERAAVDPALASAGRRSDEDARLLSSNQLRELERRRAVRRVDQHDERAP